MSNNFLIGIYEDEDILLKAVKETRNKGVNIHEIHTPYPVHGLDKAMGLKRSRIDIVAFLCGCVGTFLALLMQIWMMGFDWPMIIGGKSTIPLPDFIPVTFELTILLCALGMVATFFIRCRLLPGVKAKMFDPRSVNDKFVMAVELDKNDLDDKQITKLLKDTGASEVNKKKME